MTRLIGITGGIGSGKSVVSRILRIKGYEVVDTDALARRLMDGDEQIKDALNSEIAPGCVHSGVIDRRLLAESVFSDSSKLSALNALVHGAVLAELGRIARKSTQKYIFVETAIFYQSGLHRLCCAEWEVTAPVQVRIERVMQRNGLTRGEVEARIRAQQYEVAEEEAVPGAEIVNDGSRSVLLQICDLLAGL